MIEQISDLLRRYYLAARDADEGGEPCYEADWAQQILTITSTA